MKTDKVDEILFVFIVDDLWSMKFWNH